MCCFFPCFRPGCRHNAVQPLKKDWKTKYDYVGAVHDGRILVHRGGEDSNPRMGRFYTDGCFGYTETCGTVVIPLIYDYADSFSNGFAVVGKVENK